MASRELLAPSLLYGVGGRAGHGWKSIAARVWKEGWAAALDGQAFIDVLKNTGPIVLGDSPNFRLFPEYRERPFYNFYVVRSELIDLAVMTGDPRLWGPKLRDLSMEALDWPWYALSTLWPEGGFLPCYDRAFSTCTEWEEEEKRVAKAALKKLVRHFQQLDLVEHRLTRDLGAFELPNNMNYRVMAALSHCAQAGIPESEIASVFQQGPKIAEQKILAWAGEL